MELNRKNTKTIALLILLFVSLLTAAMNLDFIFKAISYVISLFDTVVIGFCLAFVFNVFMRALETKVFRSLKESENKFLSGIVRPLCIILTLVFVFGIISLAVLVIIPELKSTFLSLAELIPQFFDTAISNAYALLAELNFDLSELPQIDIDWQNVFSTISKYLSHGTTTVIVTAADVTTTIIGIISNVVISFVIALYVLAKKESVCLASRRLTKALLPENIAEYILHIAATANEVFTSFITGQLTEAVILGSLCFIGMMIFDFPYAVVISVLMTVTALIPIVGAFIGLAVGAFLILMVSPIKALLFIVFILCLQQFEGNIIYPKVVGQSVGLPGILVFIAVIVGGNIAGIIGTLLSVPITALLYVLIRDALDQIEEKRGLSH